QSGVLTFARHQLSRSPGATGHLRTLARLHFNTVNRATERHIAQRQSVPRLDRRVITGLNLIASLNTFRRNDVTTLTIGIQNQRDERGTVRIVFETLNFRRHTVFVALEIDQTIMLTAAATNVARGDAAVVVATTGFVLTFEQRLVRLALVQIRIDHTHDKAAAR